MCRSGLGRGWLINRNEASIVRLLLRRKVHLNPCLKLRNRRRIAGGTPVELVVADGVVGECAQGDDQGVGLAAVGHLFLFKQGQQGRAGGGIFVFGEAGDGVDAEFFVGGRKERQELRARDGKGVIGDVLGEEQGTGREARVG